MKVEGIQTGFKQHSLVVSIISQEVYSNWSLNLETQTIIKLL